MIKYDIPGSVVLIGTPAEETLVGKAALLKKGACGCRDRSKLIIDADLDACMMLHPGQYRQGFGGVKPSLSIKRLFVTYKGKGCHAGGMPCE